jgi:putative ubiquitin-RnfH superfamily antitoxin RatB of RatAB toxin-antitoxin module
MKTDGYCPETSRRFCRSVNKSKKGRVSVDDNVRKLFDKLKKRAIDMGAAAEYTLKQAGRKTGDTVEIAKLNMKIFDINSEIDLDFRKLGELVYAVHNGREADDNEIESLISGIEQKLNDIVLYKERIGILKGSVECPVCQSICGKDDKFCKKCGSEL